MTSLTVRMGIAQTVCCFNLTRILLKTCLFIENILSTSACTQDCFHHNHQTVVLWITQTILLCGYPWPVLVNWCNMAVWCFCPFRWSISICIQWTLNQENSPHTPHEAPMQPVVSSFECCLNFFSWKATDTECWTGMCSSKAILLGDICWNVSGTGSYPYEVVPVDDSCLEKLTFNCFSWHLCGRDATCTPWDHWLIIFTPLKLKVVTAYHTQFIRVLHAVKL